MTDSLGAPIAYANVVIMACPYTGAMTDVSGKYRFEVPPGRYDIVSLAMGYELAHRMAALDRDQTLTIDIALRKGNWQSTGTAVEAPVSDRNTPVTTEQLQSTHEGVYPQRAAPLRRGALELSLRYEQKMEGDSVVTYIIAARKNVSSQRLRECGCFSFWKVDYGIGPELRDSIPIGGTYHYRGPVLSVHPRECDSRRLLARPVVLRPGKSDSSRIRVAFRPRDFETWTGEVTVLCLYFWGDPGDAWVDTKNVALTEFPFVVPVRPPGMPYQQR